MQIETFKLERGQSLFENDVAINLSESGIEPLTPSQLLSADEQSELLELSLGYGYTNGTPQLRDAVARIYDVSRDQVTITNGSAEANFSIMFNAVEAGDEICMMTPNYFQMRGLAKALGAKIVPLPLKEALGWQLDPEDIARTIGPNTKAICLCNPNNPTGSVMSHEVLEAVTTAAEKHQCLLVVDEVYRGAELSGIEGESLIKRGSRNTVVVGGLSKAYALPGLRIGWVVGSPQWAEKVWHLRDYTTIAAGAVSNFMATIALREHRRSWILERNRQRLRTNLEVLQEWLAPRSERFHFIPPAAGAMAFIRYDHPIPSSEICTLMRQKYSVLVVPGSDYDMEGYLRLGFGGETEEFREGLRRLGQFFDQIP